MIRTLAVYAGRSRMSARYARFRATGLITVVACFLLACSASPDRVPTDFVDQAAELEQRTLEDVVERYPDARKALDGAVGYAIFSKHSRKLPMVGRGEGLGVAVDVREDRRHYLSVTHFDVGGGVGDLTYRLVIVFFDPKDFERLHTGTLHLGASVNTAAVGETTGYGASDKGKRAVYVLRDSGVAATWVVRLIRFKPLAVE